MKLKEIILKNKNNFEAIYQALVTEMISFEENKQDFQKVWQQLLFLIPTTPSEVDFVIKVEAVSEDPLLKKTGQATPFFVPYVTVSGLNLTDKNNNEETLEFTPWSNWLAADIRMEDVHLLGETKYLAQILKEITTIAFDEKTIQSVLPEAKASLQLFQKNYPQSVGSDFDDFFEKMFSS